MSLFATIAQKGSIFGLACCQRLGDRVLEFPSFNAALDYCHELGVNYIDLLDERGYPAATYELLNEHGNSYYADESGNIH